MALLMVLGILLIPLPPPVQYYSTVLTDRQGNLLGATIADDGQWRFPPSDSIPEKVAHCIQFFEDRHFYRHPGVNPLAMGRATVQNIRAGRIISGASTITMQIARMRRKKSRTIWQKTLELGLALKLEARYTKDQLMVQYASLAPFGGNVVGLEAASWRYYERPAHLLSWGEAAALAVLPNNPGAIYPGKSNGPYRKKRDRLLSILLAHEVIDQTTYELSLLEPLPGRPFPVPQKAPHLLSTLKKQHAGKSLKSTIDPGWQSQTTRILEQNHRQLAANGVDNAAVLVVDLQTAEVLAYCGNTNDRKAEGYQVDLIHRRRSPGSSLKPLLLAHAMTKGQLLPNALLPDIPTFFGGFSPKNFSSGYAGAVPASEALSKSLNIPFTYLLKDYSYEQFYQDLKDMGFSTLDNPPGHYGLSMILGGAEVTLWDLANAYLNVYAVLARQSTREARITAEVKPMGTLNLDAASVWHTLKSMAELTRPYGEQDWQEYSSSQYIAWKTGTSFGHRDAWAIGLNGNVLIAVWVGNADGEGRAGLTGIRAAAPILMSAMRLSDHEPNWLQQLKPEMTLKNVCSESGFLAGTLCPKTQQELPPRSDKSGICPYHQAVHLGEMGMEVNSSCYTLALAKEEVRFILPPKMGHYYQRTHPEYRGRPSMHPGCKLEGTASFEIQYPSEDSKIYIPTELAGTKSKVIMEAMHTDIDAQLFWSIGNEFFGKTSGDHKLEVLLSAGDYVLRVEDGKGNSKILAFQVVSE
ncbi:MAG: penicillin-binding protein 1C [Bacteroidota bacterium]